MTSCSLVLQINNPKFRVKAMDTTDNIPPGKGPPIFIPELESNWAKQDMGMEGPRLHELGTQLTRAVFRFQDGGLTSMARCQKRTSWGLSHLFWTPVTHTWTVYIIFSFPYLAGVKYIDH